MIMFLVICQEVRYAAQQQKLNVQDPKIKKAMYYTVNLKLGTVLMCNHLKKTL